MAKRRKENLPSLGEQDLAELDAWLAAHESTLPEVVKSMIAHYKVLLRGLASDGAEWRSTITELRRALGIIPSSERRKNSGDPIGGTRQPGDSRPKSKKERLQLNLLRARELRDWHRKFARQHQRRLKGIEERLMKLEDIELSAADEEELAAQQLEFDKNLQAGGEADPAMESPTQAFMRGAAIEADEESEIALVDQVLLADKTVVSRMIDQRTRYNFSINLTTVTIDTEKVVFKQDDGTTSILTGKTDHLGPPRSSVTWEFVANLGIMVALYAMPFNRLGGLITTPAKRFTSASLSRIFCYAARRFLPIYLHNFRVLANAEILSGDDTSTRVLEVERYFRGAEENSGGSDASPWKDFATAKLAQENLKESAVTGLGAEIAAELGFEFPKKDGSGTKKSLATTVIWGRGIAEDPRSAIIFYRSHLGGFGNLLSIFLKSRSEDHQDIIVQSDLAAINLVDDDSLTKKFRINHAGCASHARRPFAVHEAEDPDRCAQMLHLFKGLYINEKCLDLAGRNATNVRLIRDSDSRLIWEEIRDVAHEMTKKWSKATKLGTAARYIIRHYDKLTAYLNNPKIPISNDFSERMLRIEKLIQSNALFRNSLEGRFALDIQRTILQTAIAAGVPLQKYVTHVLRANPEEVRKNPEHFTAFNFKPATEAEA